MDDIFGVDAKKQSAPTLVEKDIGDLAKEQNMSEIEYINYVSENHSDENVIIQISSFIAKTWSKLTKQIRSDREKHIDFIQKHFQIIQIVCHNMNT